MKHLTLSNQYLAELRETEIQIQSAARLHFGFLDTGGSLGRKFGSLGLSLSNPEIEIRVRTAADLVIYGPDEGKIKLALKYAKLFYEHPRLEGQLADHPFRGEIHLDKMIPSHQGLGSGTQLALCVVMALCQLHGVDCSVSEVALMVRRGLRSGIGIESFKGGGFIVDGGSADPGKESPLLLFRHSFPENWRAIVVFPPGAHGLNGRDEENVFVKMNPDPQASKEICQLVLMKLLPGLIEVKLEPFAEALEQIQRITGASFADFQSGHYASSMAEDIFLKMRQLGVVGMGQSSWGPTLYGFADSPAAASRIVEDLRKYFGHFIGSDGAFLEVSSLSGRNVGARVKRVKISDERG